MENYDVVIVGAGAAGIGIAAMLKDFGVENMVVLEREMWELLLVNGQKKCGLSLLHSQLTLGAILI